MTRDLTPREFLAAVERHGMKISRYDCGYCEVLPGIETYRFNGGPTRREQLAYLLKQQRRLKRRFDV